MRAQSTSRLGLVLGAACLLVALTLGAPHAAAVCQASGKSCVLNTATNDRLCCPGMLCGYGNVCQIGCRINGTFYPSQMKNPNNQCQACQPSISTSSWSSVAAGTSCNDSNACTTADRCSAGTCVGGPALNCNDNNVCTTDTCNPATGCVRSNNILPCDNNTVCDGHEVCSGGTCRPGTPLNCNDSKVCTTDSCDPVLGCKNDNNTLPCDNNTVCDGHEVCGGGICNAGVPPVCQDSNPCTTDSCDPVAGCQRVNNTLPCDNNTVCDGHEVCGGGTCNPGTPLDCFDNNECTYDDCNAATGCFPVPIMGFCNHGTQVCVNGICQPCSPACVLPQTCGGGGSPGVCGCTDDGSACAGKNCGTVVNNCGQTVSCGGACSLPETCAGAGTPNLCEIPPGCVNLCLQQVSCANPAVTTTVSGKVLAPNGVEPIYNAFVYVPNGTVDPFTPGVACDSCGAPVSGSPLVSAVSAVNGSFTLSNVPPGVNVPLVLQVGRWRRQVTIPTVLPCVNNSLPSTPAATALTRLPRTQAEGDIPLMAVATGSADSLECALRKIGVADTEFTASTGTGRIHLYRGLDDPSHSVFGGAGFVGGATESALWSSLTQLNKYDMVFFPCQGGETTRATAALQNLIDYADGGGRVFATHFSYIWLNSLAPFSGTATWAPSSSAPADQLGFINGSFPTGAALIPWLLQVGASPSAGRIPLTSLRQDIHNLGVVAPSRLWINLADPTLGPVPVQYTFDTPVGAAAAQQCGRVLFGDFHADVESVNPHLLSFPAECASTVLSPQEKLLEFMLFDQKTCTQP